MIEAQFRVYKLSQGYNEVDVSAINDEDKRSYISGTMTFSAEGLLCSYSEKLEEYKDRLAQMIDAVGIDNMEELVETTNLMSGETVTIPKEHKGTAMDPSQERYWSA